MARFTHPAIIDFGVGTPGGSEWDIQGGVITGTQPTFDGDPLFSGKYMLIGDLCHFDIEVDFSNILTFGEGQYYMTLPFPADMDYSFGNGRLSDASTGDFYTITGEVVENSIQMELFSVGSNGRGIAFQDDTPIKLTSSDTFHISGTYRIRS